MFPTGRAHHRSGRAWQVERGLGQGRSRPHALMIPGCRGRVADIINDEQAWASQHMDSEVVSTRQAAEDGAMGKLLTALIL